MPDDVIHRQGQDSVINKHRDAEFQQVGGDVDVLAGQEEEPAGQDQADFGRPEDDEQCQYPLVLVDVAAEVAADEGYDEIDQQVQAKEIADNDILTKSAQEGRDDADALAVMEGHENDEDEDEVRLAHAVKHKRQDGSLQNKDDEGCHDTVQFLHNAAAPLIPSTLSRFV